MATRTKESAKAPVKKAAAASTKTAAAKSAVPAEEQKRKKTGAAASPASLKKVKEQPTAKVTDQPKDKSEKEKDKDKPKKVKLVRDSFTMPEDEYQALGDIKKACIKAGFEIKKSELLRIGVALLKKVPPPQIQESLSALVPLKAGRPKKEK